MYDLGEDPLKRHGLGRRRVEGRRRIRLLNAPRDELARSRSWYRDLLGFELIYKLDEMGWCELRTPWKGISIGIGQSEEARVGGTTPVFGVGDIEAAAGTSSRAPSASTARPR